MTDLDPIKWGSLGEYLIKRVLVGGGELIYIWLALYTDRSLGCLLSSGFFILFFPLSLIIHVSQTLPKTEPFPFAIDLAALRLERYGLDSLAPYISLYEMDLSSTTIPGIGGASSG